MFLTGSSYSSANTGSTICRWWYGWVFFFFCLSKQAAVLSGMLLEHWAARLEGGRLALGLVYTAKAVGILAVNHLEPGNPSGAEVLKLLCHRSLRCRMLRVHRILGNKVQWPANISSSLSSPQGYWKNDKDDLVLAIVSGNFAPKQCSLENYLHSICIACGFAKSRRLKVWGLEILLSGRALFPSWCEGLDSKPNVGVGVIPEGELVMTGSLWASAFSGYRDQLLCWYLGNIVVTCTSLLIKNGRSGILSASQLPWLSRKWKSTPW